MKRRYEYDWIARVLSSNKCEVMADATQFSTTVYYLNMLHELKEM
jgi:hypothetical protein